ncbi:hypothetical protein SADUNF_Sadunf17G0062900 [Salix dunnii]|uniref:Uncharacterized protein n=1 Tax=Salix dunnii TaxID=1413687 RepID=A0A835J7N9_9ROSI|nr:hypothetical protein SADUNF_Sadunf17G0062900 [Salix dunnii]
MGLSFVELLQLWKRYSSKLLGIKIDDIPFIFIQSNCFGSLYLEAMVKGKTIGKFGLQCEKHIVYGDWLGANAKWLVDGLDGCCWKFLVWRVRSSDWSKLPTLPLAPRDVATQMSPVASNHSSPTRKPLFPNSTPSALPIVELQSVHSSKSEPCRGPHDAHERGEILLDLLGKTIGKFGLQCEKHIVYGDWLGANAKWLVDGLDGCHT